MPKNDFLFREFGYTEPIAKEIIQFFLNNIKKQNVKTHYNKWQSFFEQIYGNLSKIHRIDKKLEKEYDISKNNLSHFLFAIQTYFNIIIKLLAYGLLIGKKKPSQTSPINSILDGKLHINLEKLENGELLKNLGVSNFSNENLFSWYLINWNEEIEGIFKDLINKISKIQYDEILKDENIDQLQILYQNIIPQGIRHQLGEYYTPKWLANFLIDKTGFKGDLNKKILDPSCGSGIFLSLELKKILKKSKNSIINKSKLLSSILENIIGFEINPLAIITAKINYLFAIHKLIPFIKDKIEIPIYSYDAINAPPLSFKFDLIIGNPPWINWEDLDNAYRESTINLWKNYGLFSLKGHEARLGGGRKDISMLFTYAVAEKYLKNNGILGFLITQTVFKTLGAGEGFRRFQIGNKEHLKVIEVIDLVDVRPFQNASNMTSILIIKKGIKTEYPIPYTKIIEIEKSRSTEVYIEQVIELKSKQLYAEPITKPTSPWFTTTKKLLKLKRLIGPSPYVAYLGLNTGGANGIYWLNVLKPDGDFLIIENRPEEGKKRIKKIKHQLEKDLIYPLVKSKNLRAWKTIGDYTFTLMVQDPKKRSGLKDLEKKFPKTYQYLKNFENFLKERPMFKKYFNGSRAPFYTMFNIGTYTFAPFKVVWNRMGNKLNSSVLCHTEIKDIGKRIIIPDNVLTFIPFNDKNEAYYVCSIMNSKLCSFLLQKFSLKGGKSFAPPSIIKFLNIPKFDLNNEIHKKLAILSENAHLNANNERLKEIVEKINNFVFNLYNLSLSEKNELKNF
ncbi:MAG: N-6 DNA methylase [Candidatus Helarchaeota archaeon]|nr:N-6 DNA methylase [Candidatus Helarchaeota archaeon]